MSTYMSRRFAGLSEYVPGEQPQDKKYIKLNTNESPFSPSPSVIEAITKEQASMLNLYPDPDCRELTLAIADRYKVKPENVFLSNGSDDILNFCFMGFCDDEKRVAFPEISYGFYEVYANLYNLDYRAIPLRSDFSICPEDYCSLGMNVVIANPNAPTGLILSVSDIEKIVKSNPEHVVLIDEAYIDYGGESCLPLVEKYENVIICMTFSKSRSLAGARLGFAISQKPLIDDLKKIKNSTNPYNINRLTNLAGIASIKDESYFRGNCGKIIEVREYTKNELKSRGFTVTDSVTNFLFAASDRIGGEELYLKLKDMGVLVRHFKKPKIENFLRITIGTKDQMDVLLSSIDRILGGS